MPAQDDGRADPVGSPHPRRLVLRGVTTRTPSLLNAASVTGPLCPRNTIGAPTPSARHTRAVQLAPTVVENRLAEWRRLLRGSTSQARAVLQRVVNGRLVFTPNGSGYDFKGPTRFDRLFSGIVVASVPPWIELGDTTGHEGIGPEDTGEADYGRLLERVYGKGDSSPAGFEGLRKDHGMPVGRIASASVKAGPLVCGGQSALSHRSPLLVR